MIKKETEGFKEFLREHGVVGLAIGFVLGGAVGKLVTALVIDIINPFIGLILGRTKGLEKLTFHVGTANILLGNFISALIDFSIIALVVYFGFKWLKLDRLHNKKDGKELKEEIAKKVKKTM